MQAAETKKNDPANLLYKGRIMMKKQEPSFCEEKHIHKELLADRAAKMPEEKTVLQMADAFKLFSDFGRIRILCALSPGELCVCDLAQLVGMTQSAVSHQLRLLRSARLVKFRKSGKSVFYSLDDDHVNLIIAAGLSHISEE